MTMRLVKSECSCSHCQRACQHTPGWFRPGEAEKAAQWMGLSLRDFFRKHLMVNWWCDTPSVFVLTPAVQHGTPGREFPANPTGVCAFFRNGKCQIHPVKPYECAHGNPHDENNPERIAAMKRQRATTVRLWKKQQGQIRELLGREPEESTYSFLEAMFW